VFVVAHSIHISWHSWNIWYSKISSTKLQIKSDILSKRSCMTKPKLKS